MARRPNESLFIFLGLQKAAWCGVKGKCEIKWAGGCFTLPGRKGGCEGAGENGGGGQVIARKGVMAGGCSGAGGMGASFAPPECKAVLRSGLAVA